jgi:hypothetical protein
MVHLSKFVHTETGKYIMSLLLGFGLATFFRTICKGHNCILFYAPPLEEIENKIYKYDNKCYKYVANSAKCDKNKKIIEFA